MIKFISSLRPIVCFSALCTLSGTALAAGGMHDDPLPPVLLGLIVLFIGARIGAYLASKIHQPAVLGELVMGVLLGNAAMLGYDGFYTIGHSEIFEILAGIGVVLLLFEVGLESSIRDLMKVGVVASVVAVIGVVCPFILGVGTSWAFHPEQSMYLHAFIGATLCATSVGITARVFKDLGKIHTREAKIILGAAVIDDVLGLLVLAVVSGIIVSLGDQSQAGFTWAGLGWITAKAVGFLALAIILGERLAPSIFKLGARLKVEGMLLSLALSLCFLLSYLASLAGLAPIVGAFAAGLILDEAGCSKFFDQDKKLDDLILPVSKFFVPIFFVHMGMQVDLATFADPTVLLFGLSLTVVAFIGKQACGLGVFGVSGSGVNRLAVGIGMVPRGEVGLIFAVIGAGLMLDGERVVGPATYSAIVLMVMITTMITPPGLKWALARGDKGS